MNQKDKLDQALFEEHTKSNDRTQPTFWETYGDFTSDQYRHRVFHRPFGKFKRRLIFGLIFFINILINIDHGAIPAATTVLKREHNLDNVSLGIIGSLVYLGLVIGAISAGPIFSTYSSKWIVILSLIVSCLFLYFFTIAENVFPLSVCRVGCGYFQVFCFIYFPVWVDQFGIANERTLWLTFLQLGVPMGTMVGYVIQAYFINKYDNWRGCFYTQIFFLVGSIVLFVLTPDKFFSKNYKRSETAKEKWEQELLRNNHTNNSKDIVDKYGRPSMYSMFSLIDESEDGDKSSYYSILYDLYKNKTYLFTMLAICSLLFIITGIQFWISDYMQIVLHMNPKHVFITFAVVCITAPTLGVLSGGYFIQKLGGYTNRRALEACFKVSILACASGVFLPLINNIFLFVLLIWLLLFFGGSLVPGLTGIMISSTPEKTKEIANSITHLCYNLLGYLPSPFLYGLVCKFTGGAKSRFGLAFILLWSFFGVFFLFIARKAQQEHFRELDQNEIILEDTRQNKEEKSEMFSALYGRVSIK